MSIIRIIQSKILTPPIFLIMFVFSCTLSNSVPTSVTHNTADPKNAFVTFIIPTLGRSTLSRTISSLEKQNNPNWEAIVIFDGIETTKLSSDPRIKLISIAKTGQFNHAGEVRNQGMEQVKTPWIAFVNDDDYLSTDYVDRLSKEIALEPSLEVAIFRMYHPTRAEFIPAPQSNNFSEANVGISFSMKTQLYQDGFSFKPGPTEDFKLLERIRSTGHKMVLSPYVTYWIREAESKQVDSYSDCVRAYIN